jgi:diguanylate cyclase (GGDEF)-like protein
VEGRHPWLGNPLSWRIADRCFAVSLIMVFATTCVFVATLAGGWPFVRFDAHVAPGLLPATIASVVAWAILALVSRMRREAGGGAWLTGVVVLLFSFSLSFFTLVDGPFDSPGWMAFLGGAVIGYVLFPRWQALGGVVLYATLVIALSLVLGAGHFPEVFAPAAAYVEYTPAMVVRRASASLALFALPYSVIMFIVDRWRVREQGYEKLASTDSLTGLTNRRRFMELAAQELLRARRYGSSLALILIDLDHFKRINDEHGHLVGDQALVHAAKVLASSVRDVDFIARHGGEEFAVLLPMTDADGAAEVAERCTRRLADTPLIVDGLGPIRVTASMGVASCAGGRCGDLDDLLRVADAALYRAKEAGRDRVEMAVW